MLLFGNFGRFQALTHQHWLKIAVQRLEVGCCGRFNFDSWYGMCWLIDASKGLGHVVYVRTRSVNDFRLSFYEYWW